MSPTMSDTAPVVLTDGAVAIGGRPVLRGIDLTVASGEFVALMGANGSGKSTLVRALTGLLPLTAGSLELFGTPIDDFADWRRIGFVPQRVGRGVRRTGLGVGGGRLRPAHPPPAAPAALPGRPDRDRRGDRGGRADRRRPATASPSSPAASSSAP